MHTVGQDSLNCSDSLTINNKQFHYFSLPKAAEKLGDISTLPFSLKVLLENMLRFEDGEVVTTDDAKAIIEKKQNYEIAYRPARVLMQDFTGVPAVVDLAAMRTAMEVAKADPNKINPLSPVDLVIDHSVQVDNYGNPQAFSQNVQLEMERNLERYEFLRWGQTAFSNFQVVPPGTGICHQVNLEYLAKSVWNAELNGKTYAYPDTLVGTDSHTTMINGLGVLGWGVGGIEAEAAMLGQPISMLIPDVVGMKLEGNLNDGVTATDLVLTITQQLREHGVVGKFVEFYGPGLKHLSLADRATISNMAPEYGATCGFFPIDDATIDYLKLSGRSEETIELVTAYCKAQGMWHDESRQDPVCSAQLSCDLTTIVPSLAGPKRPQDKVTLSELPSVFDTVLKDQNQLENKNTKYTITNNNFELPMGAVVIAAITSCTNTSNPSVLMAAGLVAKKAVELGLTKKPWVKTSLAPGSKVVTEYLEKAGLQNYLNQLGFYLVGYGCTTCIGNSGPLDENIEKAISEHNMVVSAVLSGNRNFEGRVHPQTKANWLASPPLVVAYALAGTTQLDLSKDPIGTDKNNNPVYLKNIWPSNQEVAAEVAKVSQDMFVSEYADVFSGDQEWQGIDVETGNTYGWPEKSTYVQHPPYFENMPAQPAKPQDITDANILALLGDSITTDHISPAGAIKADSPAGKYLQDHGVTSRNFNSYGSRRGNHQVMMRGTFANIRIRNEMAPGTEGGFTTHVPSNEVMAIFDAAEKYKNNNTPLVVIAGKDYGMGSSRDWAAKGTLLLGVKAVITESYERIHRSNLIGMGVLPLEFTDGMTRKSLNLTGHEKISISGIADGIEPRKEFNLKITYKDGSEKTVPVLCRIDTQNEVEYYTHGGILHYVLRQLMAGE